MPTEDRDVERKRWPKFDRYGHLHATRRGPVILLVRTRGPRVVKLVVDSVDDAEKVFGDLKEQVAERWWTRGA